MKEREFAAKEKLEIVNVRGGTALNFACPPCSSRAKRGRIPFELFQEYTVLLDKVRMYFESNPDAD